MLRVSIKRARGAQENASILTECTWIPPTVISLSLNIPVSSNRTFRTSDIPDCTPKAANRFALKTLDVPYFLPNFGKVNAALRMFTYRKKLSFGS